MKEDKKVTVTIELDNDTYFEMLRVCYERRQSIDDFVEETLKYYIKLNKSKKVKK